MKRFILSLSAILLSVFGTTASAQSGRIEVLWLGQSCFKIVSPSGKTIVIDPWLVNNPKTPAAYKQLEALGKIDALLVTHAHGDHYSDGPALAKMHNVPMYAPGDMNNTVVSLGILPPALAPRFNKGGTFTPTAGIKVSAVHAEHSSLLVWRNPTTNKDETHAAGEPVGFIIELENGFRIYHAGDTAVFGDMKWISERYKPDLALIPIGGHFTMDPEDAAYAVREIIKPKAVIPMHYGANPMIMRSPKEFINALGHQPAIKVVVPEPGEPVYF